MCNYARNSSSNLYNRHTVTDKTTSGLDMLENNFDRKLLRLIELISLLKTNQYIEETADCLLNLIKLELEFDAGQLAKISKNLDRHSLDKLLSHPDSANKILGADNRDFILHLGLHFAEEKKYVLCRVISNALAEEFHFGSEVLLAAMLVAKKNPPEALKKLQDIEKLYGQTPITLNLQSIVYKELNHLEKHAKALERLLQLGIKSSAILNDLGNVYQAQNFPMKAKNYYLKALKIDPNNGNVYYNLARTDISEFTAEVEQKVKALASTWKHGRVNMKHALFCCALVMEKKGDFETAFRCIKLANTISQSILHYDVSSDAVLFDALKREFKGPLPKILYNAIDFTPIFIVGLPRSGTTIIEQLLINHPDISSVGEVNFFNEALNGINIGNKNLMSQDIYEIRDKYVAKIKQRAVNDSKFIIDKLPLNFRWIGFIRLALPEAKIIYASREKLATTWSLFSHNFYDEGNGFSNNLNSIKSYIELTTELMEFWINLWPQHIFNLNNEGLIKDKDMILEQLYNYLGLEYQIELGNIQEYHRVVSTASHAQVRQGVYKARSSNWKNYQEFIL